MTEMGAVRAPPATEPTPAWSSDSGEGCTTVNRRTWSAPEGQGRRGGGADRGEARRKGAGRQAAPAGRHIAPPGFTTDFAAHASAFWDVWLGSTAMHTVLGCVQGRQTCAGESPGRERRKCRRRRERAPVTSHPCRRACQISMQRPARVPPELRRTIGSLTRGFRGELKQPKAAGLQDVLVERTN